MDKQLNFEKSSLMGWTIIVVLISAVLILNCFFIKSFKDIKNQNNEMKIQNDEMKKLLKEFISKSENNHYETMDSIIGSRDLFLDLEEK